MLIMCACNILTWWCFPVALWGVCINLRYTECTKQDRDSAIKFANSQSSHPLMNSKLGCLNYVCFDLCRYISFPRMPALHMFPSPSYQTCTLLGHAQFMCHNSNPRAPPLGTIEALRALPRRTHETQEFVRLEAALGAALLGDLGTWWMPGDGQGVVNDWWMIHGECWLHGSYLVENRDTMLDNLKDSRPNLHQTMNAD